jgi:Ca2+-binding RTX toxin-like protein
VTCQSPAPVFPLGQAGARVSATVADATSGATAASASGAANTDNLGKFTTPVTGSDRAGFSTTRQCAYEVVVPPCRGLKATIVGTMGEDTIRGTIGRDVIVSLGGEDTIDGGLGDDVICGGAGEDTINGGFGNDILDGERDEDILNGGLGTDTCTRGGDRLTSCESIT